jgi:hypothetical protein
VVRLSGPAGGYPARGGAAWAWFLLLLLLAALGAYAARNRLAHDWATLVIDLPWAGFVLALLGLALGRWRARRPAAAKASRPARRGLIAAAGLAAVALLFLLAPSLLLAGRTGLTVRAARAWGVMEGGPAIESPVEPRALGGIPAGTAPFLVASGWVYAPGSGTYAPTIASAGPATLWIDGRPIVVVPPAPEAEPVVGVDRGRYRESTVYLDRGFHRLTVWYSAGAGPRPRWRLPYADALHRLPVDHLLSDETSPAERGMRARLLAARRWGVLGLASLAVASVAAVLARVAPTVAGGRAGGLSTAGHAAVALICFTLTGTSPRAPDRPPGRHACERPRPCPARRAPGDAPRCRPIVGRRPDRSRAPRAPGDPGRARRPLSRLRGWTAAAARGPQLVPLPVSRAPARAAAPPRL